MYASITISKIINLILLVVGFVSFLFLNQKLRYRYYQWVGLKSSWVKKILFKKLVNG
jgi:hypothetical protein